MAELGGTHSGFVSPISSPARSRSRGRSPSPLPSKSTPRSPSLSEQTKDGEQNRTSLDSNENSSLLSPTFPPNLDSLDPLAPESPLEIHDGSDGSKSVFYLFILTLAVGGLQIAWSVETSNGSPFLLSLGMSKSLLALVWIAGPLGGVLVQPYVGIRSDNCRISWGKRRPFMIAGAVATAVSFLALAWSKGIIHGFLGLFGANPESHGVQVCTIIWATIFVYILDFAINAVQAAIRAFIVDNAPTHQQEDANAWAGRITGVGNILGYLSGYADLPRHIPWLGSTQMQVLCSIAAIAILSTVAISSVYIKERDPRLEGPPAQGNPGLVSFFQQTYGAIVRLPPQIRKVCEAQFFNWLGWFGFLFYQTTYIGQLYCNPYFAAHPDLSPEEIDQKWEEATRVGTFALLIFAITSFASNIIFPFLVIPTYEAPPNEVEDPTSLHPSSSNRQSTTLDNSLTSLIRPPRLTRLLQRLQIPHLTLRRAWLLSHFLFAICMFSTFFITSVTAATVQTAIIGIPWALSLWAPFALISAEISQRDSAARQRRRRRDRPYNNTTDEQLQRDGDGEPDEIHDQAGVILGLHNVAVSAPQILATLIGSAIFHAVQKPRGVAGDDSVGWVMRFGGLAGLAAAWFTWRVGEGVGEGGNGGRGGGMGKEGRGRYTRVGEGAGAGAGTGGEEDV